MSHDTTTLPGRPAGDLSRCPFHKSFRKVSSVTGAGSLADLPPEKTAGVGGAQIPNMMESGGPDQSLLERKRTSTPAELATWLRGNGDVFWWPKGKFWIITAHDAARKALRDPALSCDRTPFFVSRMPDLDPRLIGDFFSVVTKMMVMSDGAEHARRRGVAARTFDQDLLEAYEPLVARVADRLLDAAEREARASGTGVFDFVESVAKALPSTILADLFSIPEADRPDFFRWSANMTAFFGGASRYQNEDGVEVNASAVAIRTYFERLIAARRQGRGDDFLSTLLAQNAARYGMPDAELIPQAIMMLVAGQVTTTDQLNNNLFTLLSEPGLVDRLRRDPALLPTAVEELNRWDPGVTFLFRVATAPTRIGAVEIPTGAVVFISTHAANRDPKIFDSPERLDPTRATNPHLAYGLGSHYCLGAPLARIQMRTLFGKMMARWPAMRVVAESSERDHYSLAFSGFKKLTIAI